MNHENLVGTVWTRNNDELSKRVYSVIMWYKDQQHIYRDIYSVEEDSITYIKNDDITNDEMDTMMKNKIYREATNKEKLYLMKSLFERSIITRRR